MPLWVWSVLAASASGALMAFCYWPLHWHFAAWVALVPILIVLPRIKPDRAMLFGALLALVFYRIALDWLFGLAGPIGVVVVIVFSVLMGFGFYVARLLIERFGITALLWAPPTESNIGPHTDAEKSKPPPEGIKGCVKVVKLFQKQKIFVAADSKI